MCIKGSFGKEEWSKTEVVGDRGGRRNNVCSYFFVNDRIMHSPTTSPTGTPPSRSYPLYTSLNPYKLEYLKVLLGKKRLNNDYAYHE